MKRILLLIALFASSLLFAQVAKNFGGIAADFGKFMAYDLSNNLIVAGDFRQTVDFDPSAGNYSITSNGQNDAFIAKYSHTGNFIWAISFGNSGYYNNITALDVDSDGNIYVVGYFEGTVDFDPGAGTTNLTASGRDGFVAKYNSSGSMVFAYNFGGSNSDEANDLVVDGSAFYVTGYFSGTAYFSLGTAAVTRTSNGFQDAFIAKYTTGAVIQGLETFGSSASDFAFTLGKDALGNVIFNYSGGETDFDPGSGSNLKSGNVLVKFDPSFNLLWAYELASMSIFDIESDASSNLYLTGYFNGGRDFDPSENNYILSSYGSLDVFLAKYNPDLNLIYAKQFGGTSADYGSDLSINSDDEIALTGYFSGTADFDPGENSYELTANGNSSDLFILGLDNNTNLKWAHNFGGTSTDQGQKVKLYDDGSVDFIGHFSGTADFDPSENTTNLTSNGNNDVFFARNYHFEPIQNSYVLSADSATVFPGDNFSIPVYLTLPAGGSFISSEISFNAFDPQLQFDGIDITGSIIEDAGWTYESNYTGTALYLAFAGSNEINADGLMFNLNFSVPEDADTATIPISFMDAIFDTLSNPVEFVDGQVLIQFPIFYGDVDLNEIVQAHDAAKILQYLAGTYDFTPRQILNAEVTLNGEITAMDASVILQYVVHKIDSLPYTDVVEPSGMIQLPDYLLASNHYVEIPISNNGLSNIYAFEGSLEFDLEVLTFYEFEFAGNNANYMKEVSLVGNEIRFIGSASKSHAEGDIFAYARFTLDEGVSNPTTTVNLKKLRFNEEEVMRDVSSTQIDLITGVNNDLIPASFSLDQNYPNPFNPTTNIKFALPQNSHVRLTVFNLIGEKVAELVNSNFNSGYHIVKFDASSLSTGIYLYKIDAEPENGKGSYSAVKKLMLIK
ncbi:MAG: T9SS type A sorting domain-containing protein [Melioribacteraceae bacterium]|nr:T9SS type A sorting domain-containing protein [Melioribacteraceae bacterium]MCF8356907.1 T9SS type A sorting domain-containing protein [Melioribacteraceae bacterium]MCF8396274.1 T9SS type A sorting domain-containing protein [Melioribacteraceae bacterium]MCF8420650.1 T9SS type A sorting domain-containing protein [Melioribacteraceae bacterium]